MPSKKPCHSDDKGNDDLQIESLLVCDVVVHFHPQPISQTLLLILRGSGSETTPEPKAGMAK